MHTIVFSPVIENNISRPGQYFIEDITKKIDVNSDETRNFIGTREEKEIR